MTDVDASIPKGTIRGLFKRFMADSDDALGVPDAAPMSGIVRIQPLVSVVRWPLIVPPQTAVYEEIMCVLNASGQLCAPGSELPDVIVIASAQPDAQPELVQYRATFELDGVTAQPSPIVFEVPAGGVVDLSLVASSTPAAGTVYVLADPSGKADLVDGTVPLAQLRGAPQFIDDVAPVVAAGPYAWWDTSDGDLTLWIEDGS